MRDVLQVLFFLSLAAMVAYAVRAWRRSASPARNFDTAMAWFKAMDLIKDGQRYRGDRCDIAFDIGSGVRNGGYEIFAACETKSGRKFLVRILSMHCLVTDWDLLPTDPQEFQALKDELYPELSAKSA